MMSKEYHKQKSKDWYYKNKQTQIENSRRARIKKREWFTEIMNQEKCAHCGVEDNRVLEWHHVDRSKKDFTISRALTYYGRQRILDELEKCICLCANCHRIHHWENDYGNTDGV